MSDRFTRRRTIRGAGVLVVSGLLAGCSDGEAGSGGDGGSGTPTVEMSDDHQFDPSEITITVGDTLVWENTGSQGHTVTAVEESIPDSAEYFSSGDFSSEQEALNAYAPYDEESGYIPGGESFEHTFETAGTYEYYCIPHDQTGQGTVIVEEE